MELNNTLANGSHNMWKLFKNMCPRNSARNNEPLNQAFFEYFTALSSAITAEYFDYDYEESAIEFIKKYENDSLLQYIELEYDFSKL